MNIFAVVLISVVGAGFSALVAILIARAKYSSTAVAAEAIKEQAEQQREEKENELNEVRALLLIEREQRVRAETTLEQERKSLIERKNILDQAEQKLTSVFEGLASKVLASSTTSFLQLADATLKAGPVKDLQNLVQPLEQTLTHYQESVAAMERARQTAYGEITTTLTQVNATQETLRTETSSLVSALRRPNVRGRWGELTLRRVAELTGMAEHCDFSLQTQVRNENGDSLRPDMTIYLPKGVIIPVDSKVPLDQYLDAMSASTEAEHKERLKKHASALRERMNTLASKDYAGQFPVTPDVTVLFLPSDAFLSAALEQDKALLEDAMQQKVVIATPVSLFCLLKAVAYGWQQEAIARNARAISELGKELYSRVAVMGSHLEHLRDSLVSAVDSFDAAVGSLESRILPSVRKFKEMGATTEDDIVALEKIGREPRTLRLSAIEIKTGSGQ